MKAFRILLLTVGMVAVPVIITRLAAQSERNPFVSPPGMDREIYPIMNHGLILILERSAEEPTGHADLTIAADWTRTTVQRLAPAELRDMARSLTAYADRLEGR